MFVSKLSLKGKYS